MLGRFESTEESEAENYARLPVFDVDPRTIQHMELLSRAISEGLSVQIVYKDQEGERYLHVSPIRFASRYHADYVIVYGEDDERPNQERYKTTN
ncbi:hypothetical protein L1N85_26595 [Paenibacillus alkaliterrae]|uniref:hypothetical protein n=1 Tax=Paenibacillus alkaliterrae TaxID=320909 RepID=UPI001F46667F|nr:hypothetical protein [Paenibacillus alkaliterrae]MCF2941893.1 hypothetical protein [Paenibacillus alkaliterrae]